MVSAPTPPDPWETAQAQQGLNKETAITQYELGATNQQTPYGSLTYNQTGTSASGNPQYTATQTLSPNQQSLLTGGENLGLGMLDIAGNQLGNVSDKLSQPLNLSDPMEVQKYLFDIGSTTLDPYYDKEQAQLDTQLANKGMAEGSEGYTSAMDDFTKMQNQAYNDLTMSSYDTAVNSMLMERNQPLNELSALMSGGQVTNPQFTQTPQPGVAPVDYTGLVQQDYQAQLAQSQSAMGGLFGLGSSLISAPFMGGWMPFA